MKYNLLIIAGIIITLIVVFSFFQIYYNTETIAKIETETVDPEQICKDLLDMNFSSIQECVDFVNDMLIKINNYSQSIDCKEHQLLFKKLGIKCT